MATWRQNRSWVDPCSEIPVLLLCLSTHPCWQADVPGSARSSDATHFPVLLPSTIQCKTGYRLDIYFRINLFEFFLDRCSASRVIHGTCTYSHKAKGKNSILIMTYKMYTYIYKYRQHHMCFPAKWITFYSVIHIWRNLLLIKSTKT